MSELTPIDIEALGHLWPGEDPGNHMAQDFARDYDWFPVGAKCRLARIRRGKWVRIPDKWRGKVPQNPLRRTSRFKHKIRKEMKHGGKRIPKRKERVADVL